ncbi:DUF7144 family membrane protein [Virgisporangium aurantiacum]|uniref:Membrane protein n=1 Tax=Virgisporangium aurantiacum TaxID=175570 RepID=A0A8J4DZJ2_9ACTN|nr:hypothetical protein [Virgisporangium aurantiacum]GIJ55618.1 membrane protein [Virgisporangium aurantiacum]
MSDTQQRQEGAAPAPYTDVRRNEPTGWVGLVIFAGVMLVMLGGFQAMEGIVAIIRDEYYLVTRNGLIIDLDYTTWGWIHLVLGLLAAAAGVGIFAGQMWARVLGIVIAVMSALANMAFLAAYPIWATIMIAVDVLIIYALSMHGREVKAQY